ncbi:hypothetical protein Fmac_008431 [Flemingia macrophylla]|uniref:ATP synthase F0 subunit 8 n=1 Tax=Flemingia macrophylla TaxID=520843 RepID=A0ABD1MXE4_9FABA
MGERKHDVKPGDESGGDWLIVLCICAFYLCFLFICGISLVCMLPLWLSYSLQTVITS